MKNIFNFKIKDLIDLSSDNGQQINMNEVKGFAKAETEEERIIRKINKNFLIRYKFQDSPQTYLVGAGQYHRIVTKEIANKHFKSVLTMKTDKCTFRIRKSLTIDFMQK